VSDREDNLEDNLEDNPEGRLERRDFEEESEELDFDSSVRIEISRLSLFTHHGATDAEQEAGQRLIFDIAFEVEDCDATVTDRLEDTIDYAAVCQAVALVATERSYRTLERLCTAVADMLEERFQATDIVVRAAKPEPPIPLPVEEVAVEVER
jgi:7,8-dihydroneopterin aldolase/epimerase/oxygenase